jgi:cysteine dioxygenase
LAALLQETTLSLQALESVLEFGEINYKRNKIASGDWYDLWVICWKSGQSSPIHDHKDSSCAFRVIEGLATEQVYRLTDTPGMVCLDGQKQYGTGSVVRAYHGDIHRISNDVEETSMVTVHIYSPPLQMTYYAE